MLLYQNLTDMEIFYLVITFYFIQNNNFTLDNHSLVKLNEKDISSNYINASLIPVNSKILIILF